MLRLVDVLGIKKEDYSKYKLHFAIGIKNKREPYEKFLINEFEEWQAEQTNKNFKREYVISLIYYAKNKWLFAGIYQVNGNPVPYFNGERNLWKYSLTLMDIQKDMIGRIFVTFNKGFRASYPCLDLITKEGVVLADMPVDSILEGKITIDDFGGFDNVNISFATLYYIVKNNISSWQTALSNVKGIYLIIDTLTGNQYVGSAYGEECIWQRWKQYAIDGHGGNIELKELLKQKGIDYKNNFKYSILEVCNMNLGNDYILSRESYWKNILMTREFGLNKN